MSERLIVNGEELHVHTIGDLLRSVVRQTQPVDFSELTKGLYECLRLKPCTALDHLNDLVQRGFLTVDEQGRFSCRG